MKPNLPQIKNVSIREQTLDALREAILTGELKPGQTLTENELSAQLGVSRAPIREALRILNSENLVETIPYHGTTVRQLNRSDIKELYSMRILLETYALEHVIKQGNPDHVAWFRDSYEQMIEAGKKNDIITVNILDRDFHDELIRMTGNSLLWIMWQTVAMKVRQVMALVNRRSADQTEVARSHLPLIDAIEAGDFKLAKELLKKHTSSAGHLIAEDWNLNASSPDDDDD